MTAFLITIDDTFDGKFLAHDAEVFSTLDQAKKRLEEHVAKARNLLKSRGWVEHSSIGIFESWLEGSYDTNRFGIYITEHTVS